MLYAPKWEQQEKAREGREIRNMWAGIHLRTFVILPFSSAAFLGFRQYSSSSPPPKMKMSKSVITWKRIIVVFLGNMEI
jgi:hypothetical protein